MAASESATERAYRILSGDDGDERACEAIPESACTALPRNYTLNVANGAATKLAEQIAGPNLVLPWLLAALGVPAVIVGLLMPVKQVFSLLPQLAVSGWIRRVARRQRVWCAAGITQAAALLAMAAAVLALPPLAAGLAVVVLLAVFSSASGAGSVAFQDVAGKTVPKGRRGVMLSNRALIGGLLTMAAGLALQFWLGPGDRIGPYVLLLVAAAILWVVAAVAFGLITEHPGATGGGRNAWTELASGWARVRAVPGYRRFLLTRGLLLSVELAMPLYALHAQSLFGGAVAALGVFLLTTGLGNVISSPLWGRLSDRSSRVVMQRSGVLAGAIAAYAIVVGLLPDTVRSPYLYAGVFVLLGIAEQGVRLGRKTYLVDAAPSQERALYVAFANTATGLLALAGGLLGLLATVAGATGAVVALGLLGLAAAAAAARMPEADAMMARASRFGRS